MLKNISVKCTFALYKTGLHHENILNDVGFIVNYATKILIFLKTCLSPLIFLQK